MKLYALALLFISSGVFAGTVSGGGPRVKAESALTLSQDDFKRVILDGINNGEVDLGGEKFEPSIIDLKSRTIILNSKMDLEKTIQVKEVQNLIPQ